MLMLDLDRSRKLTRGALHRIPVPKEAPGAQAQRAAGRTNAGKMWHPIQHGELAQVIVDQLGYAGLKVTKETYALCRKDLGLIGVLDLGPSGANEEVVEMPDGLDLCFGFRHSNDMGWALTCMVGARVRISGSGFIDGQFQFSRKHTSRVDLPRVVGESIDEYLVNAASIATTMHRMEQHPVSRQEAADIIIRSSTGSRPLIPSTLVTRVYEEFVDSRYPEAFGDRNLWSLYNAYTQIAQERPPVPQINTIAGARDMLVRYLDAEEESRQEWERELAELN